MKKLVTTAALLGALSLVGIQSVSAHGGRYYNNDYSGYGYCGNFDTNNRIYTEQDQAALDKFRDDTKAIRKEIVVKRSELDAILSQDNPDENKVAKLTGDLYDLQTELDSKAEAAGVDFRIAGERGPGMMRGYGWGRGWHMMGW